MEILDAFTTENRRVLAAIEMLDTLLVLQAHVRSKIPLVCFVVLVHIRVGLEALLEIDTRQERVPRDHLVQNIKV